MPAAIGRGVAFALSTPGVHAFCTPGDLRLLPLALDAAEAAGPLDDGRPAGAMTRAAEDEIIFPLREKAKLPS